MNNSDSNGPSSRKIVDWEDRQLIFFFIFQRYRGTTRKLYTDARAQTAGRRSRSNRRVASAANTTVLSNGSAYPAEAAGAAGSASVLPGHARPKSLEIENRMTSPDETVFGSGPDDVSRGGGWVKKSLCFISRALSYFYFTNRISKLGCLRVVLLYFQMQKNTKSDFYVRCTLQSWLV